MARSLTALAVALVLLVGCSSSDSDSGSGSTEPTVDGSASTEVEPSGEILTVLVTNDDGVGAAGIDALVDGLSMREGVEVVVVAPLENQSGSAQKSTDGSLQVTETETASGHPATAVDGFPADAVRWALTEGGIDADVVISGVNDGQNVGPLVAVSGTVGAARQAAQLGVPALAVSQGFGEPADFPTGVEAALEWLDQHADAIAASELGTDSIASINAPTCTEGEVQGTVEVPTVAETALDVNAVDCAGTADPVDDVTAFVNGWITLSELAPTGSRTE